MINRIRGLTLLSTMLFAINTQGQTLSPSTLNAAGGSKDIGGDIYEYSIGEMTLVHTVSTANLIVTQGILQPTENFVNSISDLALPAIALSVYPNPFEDMITIQPNIKMAGGLTLTIMDITGRKLHQQEALLELGSEKQNIRLNSLAAGSYILQTVFRHNNQSSVSSFKIQKIK